MSGDTLAKGGKSAVFCGPRVTQEKWDSIWKPVSVQKSKEIKLGKRT